jgi:hypothetical protein
MNLSSIAHFVRNSISFVPTVDLQEVIDHLLMAGSVVEASTRKGDWKLNT